MTLFVFQYFLLIGVDVFTQLLFVHMADNIRKYYLKTVKAANYCAF